MVKTMVLKKIAGEIIGMVMLKNCRARPAPSSEATS